MKHTKEPWIASEIFEDEYGFPVVTIGAHDSEHGDSGATFVEEAIANVFGSHWDAKENARRIVACVNACRDIDTEELEYLYNGTSMTIEFMNRFQGDYINILENDIEKIEAQRDELLAALKEAEKTLAHCKADIGYRHRQTDTAIMINRVIAKCEVQS